MLSAEECIMAAHLQNKHPNPCCLATNGTFGSKFVTVVVSGMSLSERVTIRVVVGCVTIRVCHY